MGTLVNKIKKALEKKPFKQAALFASSFIPYSAFSFLNSFDGSLGGFWKEFMKDESLRLKVISPLVGYTAYLWGWYLKNLFVGFKNNKIMADLEKQIDLEFSQYLFEKKDKNEIKKVDFNLNDFARLIFFHYEDGQRWREAARKNQNPLYSLMSSLHYAAENKYDESYISFRDSIDFQKNRDIKFTKIASIFYKFILVQSHLWSHQPENTVLLSYLYTPSNQKMAAKYSELARRMALTTDNPKKLELSLICSLLTSLRDDPNKEQSWKETFDLLKQYPYWDRLGESRTMVRRFLKNEFFSQTIVLKEYDNKLSLEKELENYNFAEKIGIKHPDVLAKIVDANVYAFLMRFEPANTLHESLKNGQVDSMDDVIFDLAKIHTKMPRTAKPLRVAGKLKDRLCLPYFGLPRDSVRKIVQNYRPVYDAIMENTTWVYNKDAHPENWLISKKGVIAIDFEETNIIPFTLDLANLLSFGDYFTSEQTKNYLEKYALFAKSEGMHVEEGTLKRSYYNSVIHRMLSIASAWSFPERGHLRNKRKELLLRAANSIEQLQKHDVEYYNKNQANYDVLKEILLSTASSF